MAKRTGTNDTPFIDHRLEQACASLLFRVRNHIVPSHPLDRQKMAAFIGCHPNYLWEIESAIAVPSTRFFVVLAHKLSLPVSALYKYLDFYMKQYLNINTYQIEFIKTLSASCSNAPPYIDPTRLAHALGLLVRCSRQYLDQFLIPIAEKSGYSISNISRLERGERLVTYKHLYYLQKALYIPPHILMELAEKLCSDNTASPHLLISDFYESSAICNNKIAWWSKSFKTILNLETETSS